MEPGELCCQVFKVQHCVAYPVSATREVLCFEVLTLALLNDIAIYFAHKFTNKINFSLNSDDYVLLLFTEDNIIFKTPWDLLFYFMFTVKNLLTKTLC